MEGSVPKALVVDDDPALRMLMRVNLELDGFAVNEAGTLAEAEEALAGGRPDVVLLDIHLGRDDTGALLDALRADGVPVGGRDRVGRRQRLPGPRRRRAGQAVRPHFARRAGPAAG